MERTNGHPKYDDPISIPGPDSAIRDLAHGLRRPARKVNPLEFPFPEKRDGTAIGRPEWSNGAVGAR